MSIGSPAGVGQGATLAKALRTRVLMPAQFKDQDEDSDAEEEDMDTTTESAQVIKSIRPLLNFL